MNPILSCMVFSSEDPFARCPVAESKITQDKPRGDIIYDADHPNPLPFQQWRFLSESDTTKRNFEVFDPLDFLAQAIQHIPNHGKHLTRYYGWYSNVFRGKRAKEADPVQTTSTYVNPAPKAHQRRVGLIKQVYEANPL